MDSGRDLIESIIANVEKVIIGKRTEVEQAVVALLSGGHLLVEDVPGVGKTMLARSLARSVGCTFRRIQFTPDLLPSDVTGTSIYNQQTSQFEFRAGPVIAQIVLVDEINRATPKTQSALLEAMEEKQITVDGTSHILPAPFMVLATQNPIEYEGTFPLPEAQLDRFLMRISLGYPSQTDEIAIMDRQQLQHPVNDLEPMVSANDVVRLQASVKAIYVDPLVKQYIVAISGATRTHEAVYLGASPRGSLALFRAAQARALLADRDFVLPDDIKAMASATLAHRIIVKPAARVRDITAERVVQEILQSLPVPGARARGSVTR
ncbi:MAG: MoxR family ATPase [Chloroflexi bacterium]|nr:MoxR family ATPase [Chloroflexota bacterium]